MYWSVDSAILLRVFIAAILGAIIGWDRERRGRDAGLRTNMLVAASACLFTATGDLLVEHYAHYGSGLVRTDPTRVLNAVVLGVSFLGSGIIFVSHQRDHVLGLTTAATVWAVTAIGIVVALSHYVLAVGATVIVLLIEVLRSIEKDVV